MAKDVFLVDTRVVALLALERLLALVVEHVLLRDTQDRETGQSGHRASANSAAKLAACLCDGGTLSEDQRLQR